ncbi:ABC transporter substrate-binding protein [Butyrivibrio sp. MC2013]|uniref:ABC transporter substrate-binding protein n=1 Tax=Butyrivibrio sp. MC2013 TaxID=1280686 RepID=UPI0003F9A163|nr:extracellular solute-binding protein [Butyrivibrio sp. MC2013]
MKKRTLGFLMALLTTFTMLAGCGDKVAIGDENAPTNSSADSKESEEGASDKEPVTIQYFTWTSGSMSAIEPMVEKFNETNEDNITVEVVLKTGEWQTALKTAILSGQAPDILHGVSDVAEALSNGWIEPWDNYLSEDFKEKINPYTYKVEVNGELNTYAFVWGAKTYKMAYNKELFEKAGITELPTSWQEVYEDAKLITEAGNGDYYGFGLSSAASGSAVPFIMEPVGALEGYYKMGYDFASNRYDFSYAKPYIELFRQMIAEGITFPGAETLDNDSLRAQFAAGRIGMIPSVSWDCAAINTQFEADCDWGVFEWPVAIDGENKGALCLRDSANYMLSATSEHKEEAAKFVEFMLGEDYQSELLSKATDMSVLPWALEAAQDKPAAQFPQWVEYSPSEDMVQVSNVNLGVQITGDNESTTFAQLIDSPDMDIDATLADLSKRYNDGLLEQARMDEEKAAAAGNDIAFLGKIMTVSDFDPMKAIDPEKIHYVTADEWQAMQD